MVFSCRSLQKAFGETEVLKDISFMLEDGEKAAIVGVNGAGKTTLFKMVTGEYASDGGEISLRKGATVGYLAQMAGLTPENTAEEEVLTVFSVLIRIETELRALEEEMSRDCTERALDRYDKLSHRFGDEGGYEYRSRARGVLVGLGFAGEAAGRKVSALSGGQKTKLALCKLLLTAPDLLLLDEPTNHLDIDNLQWLEDVFMKNYPKSVLVISHDRYFLDKTVTKVIEIENGGSSVYNGNFTHYAAKKELDRAEAMKRYEDVAREVRRQEEVIKRLKSFNREKSIRAAESKEKRLEKMEKPEKPKALPANIRLSLQPRRMSGRDVLTVRDARKKFGDFTLFDNVSFEIFRGEKVALIGPNGIGKTTLFRMITDARGDSPFIRTGSNVTIGYFDQEYTGLNDEKTVFDEICDAFPTLTELTVRNALAAFVFTGDEVFKKIGMLSGGEKGRVALVKLMLGEANFLLLDEPTNHLDIGSRDILETALANYAGTVLYISHDRYFINRTADRVMEMGQNGVEQYIGNYDDYVENKAQRPQGEEQQILETESISKDEWANKKADIAGERKKQAAAERLENRIKEAEQRIREIDEKLELPEVNTDADKAAAACAERLEWEGKLLEYYREWEKSH